MCQNFDRRAHLRLGSVPEAILVPVELETLGSLLERLTELEEILGEGERALEDPALLALHRSDRGWPQ